MAVVPMIRQHHVVGVVEGADDAHLAELLPEAGVSRAGEQSLTEQVEEQLLGKPDEVTETVERARIQWKKRFSVFVSHDARWITQRMCGVRRW